jgi:hypothetical protein
MQSTLDLAAPIASYFAHEATDPQAVARCFREDAVVLDDRHEHVGRSAIAAWNAAAVAKYHATSEPLSAETDGARTVVLTRVVGEFSGSPVVLRFNFTLAGALISRLEIAP